MTIRVALPVGCTLFLLAGLAYPGPPVDPSAFHVTAKLSVADRTFSLPTGVAILQARRGAPGYSWLRIYFYSFPLDAEDIAGAMKGSVESMERKWQKKAGNPDIYNNSHGMIQLAVDKNHKVWQVDVSVPGYACTIASLPKDVEAFLQSYHFDGGKLKLTSKGSYVCGKLFANVPDQMLGWDVKVDLPVFEKN